MTKFRTTVVTAKAVLVGIAAMRANDKPYEYYVGLHTCAVIYEMPMEDLKTKLAESITALDGFGAASTHPKFIRLPDHKTRAENSAPAGLVVEASSLSWYPEAKRMPDAHREIDGVRKSYCYFTIGRSVDNPARSFLLMDRQWAWVGQARIATTDIKLPYDKEYDSSQLLKQDVEFMLMLRGGSCAVAVKEISISSVSEIKFITDPKAKIPCGETLNAKDVLEWMGPPDGGTTRQMAAPDENAEAQR